MDYVATPRRWSGRCNRLLFFTRHRILSMLSVQCEPLVFVVSHIRTLTHTHTHSRWTRNFLTCRPTDISCEENDFNRTRAAFTFVYVRMCCACVWVPRNKGGGEETIRRPCYLLAIRVQASSVVSTCTFCQYSLAVRCFLRLSPSSFFTFLSTSFKSFSAYLRISLLLMVVVCCGQCAFSHFTC